MVKTLTNGKEKTGGSPSDNFFTFPAPPILDCCIQHAKECNVCQIGNLPSNIIAHFEAVVGHINTTFYSFFTSFP